MQTNLKAGVAPAALDATSDVSREPDAALWQNRKLPSRLLVAVHQACDLGDLDVAARLLSTLEGVIIQKTFKADPQCRRTMESMIAAHHRLWQLRLEDRVSSDPIGQLPSFDGNYIS